MSWVNLNDLADVDNGLRGREEPLVDQNQVQQDPLVDQNQVQQDPLVDQEQQTPLATKEEEDPSSSNESDEGSTHTANEEDDNPLVDEVPSVVGEGDLSATGVQNDGATQQQEGQEEEEVPPVAEGIPGNPRYDPSGMPDDPFEEKTNEIVPNEMASQPSVHQQSSSPKTSSSDSTAKRSFDSSSGGGGGGVPPSGNTVPGYVIPLPPAPVTTGVEDVSPDDFFRDFRKMMTETLLKTQTAVNDTQSTLSSVLTNQIQTVHADLNNSISHFSTLLESEMMDLRYLNQLPDINLHQLANRCEFRHVRTDNVLNTLANVWIEQFSLRMNQILTVKCPSMVSLLDTIKASPNKKYFIVSACIFHHFQVENTHHVSILARMRMVIENDDPNVDDDRIMFYYLLKRGF